VDIDSGSNANHCGQVDTATAADSSMWEIVILVGVCVFGGDKNE